jgi:hypothetical protein
MASLTITITIPGVPDEATAMTQVAAAETAFPSPALVIGNYSSTLGTYVVQQAATQAQMEADQAAVMAQAVQIAQDQAAAATQTATANTAMPATQT